MGINEIHLMFSSNLPAEVCVVDLSSSSPPESVRCLQIHVSTSAPLVHMKNVLVPMLERFH